MGNLALGLGWGAEADEGYFRNKFYISAANTTKGKMIDWIQEHIYLGVQKRTSKHLNINIYIMGNIVSYWVIYFNKVSFIFNKTYSSVMGVK